MSPRALFTAAALLLVAIPVPAGAQVFASIDGGLILCSSDSDCPSPYLTCAPTKISICTGPDASSSSPPGALLDAAACPEQTPETLNLCVIRYQLPCDSGASCGPAGFTCAVQGPACFGGGDTCTSTHCQGTFTVCMSDSDCPAGWSCYANTVGPTLNPPKACYPPFTEFEGTLSGAGPGGLATLVPPPHGSGDTDAASVQAPYDGPEPKDCAIGLAPGRHEDGDRGAGVMAMYGALVACVLRRRASRRAPHN